MRTSSVAEPLPPTNANAPARPRSKTRFAPLWGVAALAGLAVIARFALHSNLPLPPCWLRKLTGIPCPTCGSTRSLAAWATLDLEQAFRFNPLFFLFCLAVIAWLALWVVDMFSQRPFLEGWQARLKQPPWWKIGLVLLALNWLYLCLTLPK